jgi:hypothetical protein
MAWQALLVLTGIAVVSALLLLPLRLRLRLRRE